MHCLSFFKEKGCDILGIDPAENIVEGANKKGIRSIAKFFNLEPLTSIDPDQAVAQGAAIQAASPRVGGGGPLCGGRLAAAARARKATAGARRGERARPPR